MKLQDIHWQEPEAKEYLTELGGSKSGAYQYLYDFSSDLHRHLPTGTHYLAPGDDLEKFLDTLNYSRRKIVRACHPLDLLGMVDVIPTMPVNRTDRDAVRFSINRVLEEAQDDEVRSFAEYESGESFDGKVGILVQDYCGTERGSIVEHPHERGLFRVGREYASITSSTNIDEEMFDEDGRQLDLMEMKYNDDPEPIYDESVWGIGAAEVQKVIALYRKIYDTGLMPESHSFQMEYGIDDRTREVMFYQSRIFKPFEEGGTFEPEFDVFTSHITMPYLTFGITPENGLEMQLAELDTESIEKYQNESQMAYAYNAYGHRCTTDLDVQPHNVAAYLPYQHQILEHGHYRWMQKAPVTLPFVRKSLVRGADRRGLHESVQDLSEEIRVRITSNGIRGVIQVID